MSESVSSLPANGRVACSKCFSGLTVWNETEVIAAGWHIVNNPMSWGAAEPQYLVLGVSKGTTQCEAISAKPHNDVPFDGFRPALAKALQLLGLLQTSETIESKISASEMEWGFGSMVRCALGLPTADNAIERSGTVVQRLAAMPADQSWITLCSSVFLRSLPASLRVVVLLSNDDGYIDACFGAIRRLRPSTRRINDVAYGDETITWVHIVHVGGPGKNHIASWFAGEGRQGGKRVAAQMALGKSTDVPVPEPQLEKVTTPSDFQAKAATMAKSARTPSVPRGVGKPIPVNPVRDAILQSMNAHASFRPHPSETIVGGTKYVSAFLGRNGRAIAFDKAVATKQPMWFRDDPHLRELMDKLRVPFVGYPPEKGRNSNLSKLAEFEGKALLRAFPQTAAEAIKIADAVVSGVPTGL
ncbi:hypothetical protein MPC4_180001 [Methylocella tundrae]|uniref:Uncharacterized protein n=1 Tax=Methylocella tundrae TaxID=227605 RepID=A0A8B6M477_METTU|nr:hypothetical protein [Methylocella tundrae]VTZ27658.1 hypothetical protein MPC1_6180002 [Methylocella tundrae]VTZ49595.1 hypothetical protein MPC4_180001 [Methylocella tundrae]